MSGTYINKAAKDGFPKMEEANLYDMFHASVLRNPTAPCLGWRPIQNSRAGPYKWLTYKQVSLQASRVARLWLGGLGARGRLAWDVCLGILRASQTLPLSPCKR